MIAYADSSFAVSLFAQDVNGAPALAHMRQMNVPLVWTGWHDLEFENAVELRIHRGVMSRSDQQACVRLLEQAGREGGISRVALDFSRALAAARALVSRHSAAIGVRAFDVFHVALAQELAASHFLSFDARQKRLAAAEGMVVAP